MLLSLLGRRPGRAPGRSPPDRHWQTVHVVEETFSEHGPEGREKEKK